VELEEQSKAATEQARASGEIKKQIVPPDLLEEVFELNMHLEELRMNKKVGDDDPALFEEIGKAKLSLETKYEALVHELQSTWKEWDNIIDRSPAANTDERAQVRNKMVDILNRRNYIRNLVRDVNEAMEQ
jgi:molecular chaperone HscB